MKIIDNIKNSIINGQNITKNEAMELYEQDLKELLNAADEIRKKFRGNIVDLCSIVNGKSGRCGENCKYCAQSAHFKTGIDEYSILSYEEILKNAKENELEGINRFSIVTSGRGLFGQEFETILEYYKKLNNSCSIKLCASHGIISKESLSRLKSTGVKRYHHNLETSKRFYNEICTTHTYEDRIYTIKNAKAVGLEVCSGGIIGMGESREDRIDMAFELKELKIMSIPINVLTPIPGTLLENQPLLNEEEILKTIAIFRFINPRAEIRLAAGRHRMTNSGELAFRGGANATITGNLLTTCGNQVKDDKEMIKNLGLRVENND